MQTASDAEKIDHTDKKKTKQNKTKNNQKNPDGQVRVSRNAANRLRTTKDL